MRLFAFGWDENNNFTVVCYTRYKVTTVTFPVPAVQSTIDAVASAVFGASLIFILSGFLNHSTWQFVVGLPCLLFAQAACAWNHWGEIMTGVEEIRKI